MMKAGKIAVQVALVVVFFVCTLAGCAGKKVKPTTPPDWVSIGSGIYKSDKGAALYGVGSVWGIKNPSLARTAADDRARAELAKIFKSYVAQLGKDYQTSDMAGNPDITSEAQHIEETLKTFTKGELTGVIIVDRWKDPATGECFSRARMDPAAFREYLTTVGSLDAAVQGHIIEKAEKSFRELEQEEARH